MSRVQLALNVSDLEASLRYQTGTEPQDSLDAPEQVGAFSVSTLRSPVPIT